MPQSPTTTPTTISTTASALLTTASFSSSPPTSSAPSYAAISSLPVYGRARKQSRKAKSLGMPNDPPQTPNAMPRHSKSTGRRSVSPPSTRPSSRSPTPSQSPPAPPPSFPRRPANTALTRRLAVVSPITARPTSTYASSPPSLEFQRLRAGFEIEAPSTLPTSTPVLPVATSPIGDVIPNTAPVMPIAVPIHTTTQPPPPPHPLKSSQVTDNDLKDFMEQTAAVLQSQQAAISQLAQMVSQLTTTVHSLTPALPVPSTALPIATTATPLPTTPARLPDISTFTTPSPSTHARPKFTDIAAAFPPERRNDVIATLHRLHARPIGPSRLPRDLPPQPTATLIHARCNFRGKYSELRELLTSLGIRTVNVLEVSYIGDNVLELLVRPEHAAPLSAHPHALGLTLLPNYNPMTSGSDQPTEKDLQTVKEAAAKRLHAILSRTTSPTTATFYLDLATTSNILSYFPSFTNPEISLRARVMQLTDANRARRSAERYGISPYDTRTSASPSTSSISPAIPAPSSTSLVIPTSSSTSTTTAKSSSSSTDIPSLPRIPHAPPAFHPHPRAHSTNDMDTAMSSDDD